MIPAGLPMWSAPAKLNLFLHITGRRDDGYHNLQTVFQLIDYGDHLAFDVSDNGVISRVTDVAGVASGNDLMVLAAHSLQSHCGCQAGVDIHIEKRLPMGGGLGGGSSDAATTLLVLNQLWGCGLSIPELVMLGQTLGADVPVFIHGTSAWAEGIGDKLTSIALPSRYFLVIKPPVEVATEGLFSEPGLTRDCSPIRIRDFPGLDMRNVFEPLVRERYPRVDQGLRWLGQFSPARLTGTGSCIFAEFSAEEDAEKVLARLPEGYHGFIARGVNQSPLLAELQAG
ncbi:MAG: 4-(cytidine 5'-diphospho)-2-C-methyl-D-erythritol kinase [Thiothrix sp.]|nr:MAG: 4-(cytidine 5'-diphospho)-2-C-methyl-D-erythritol kinase [Thiothrix sp.]